MSNVPCVRTFALLMLVFWLTPCGQADNAGVELRVESFPPGAQVFLETATGPTFLGVAGQLLVVAPPALRDASGQVVQFASGTLTLTLPGHQKSHVTVTADEWKHGRIPRDGAVKLAANTLWIGAQDYARAYPLPIGLAVLALLGLLLLAINSSRRLGTQSLQLQSLLGRLKVSGDPLLGKSLGEYQVEARLGQGGMGTVYKVRHSDGQIYAAKVYYSDSEGDINEARFRREARLVGQLNHPNLIRCYDFGEQPGLVYYIMELIVGDTLAGQVRPGGRAWPEVWGLLRPVVLGLEYAHGLGVVHRDLKPPNIMISESGQVKILDFGLAREHARTAVTKTGQSMGTPTYLAPEQISAAGAEVEPRTDQYSLGIILFELLTGAPPFDSEEPQLLIALHLATKPPGLRSQRPDLPLSLERALARLLEKDPARRFESMSALREVLDGIQGDDSPTVGDPSVKPARSSDPTVNLRRKPRTPP